LRRICNKLSAAATDMAGAVQPAGIDATSFFAGSA
jgi:hypothetical protein